MARIKLNKLEKNMVFNVLKVRLGSDIAKLEHYKALNEYDDSKMPEEIMKFLERDIETIKGIIEKLGKSFEEDTDGDE